MTLLFGNVIFYFYLCIIINNQHIIMIQEIKETIIVLDSTLELSQLKTLDSNEFNKQLTKPNYTTVRDCINGEYRHKNYLQYLNKAWGSHYGVIVSPDILWFIILNEIATHIKENSNKYKNLFTTSDNKVEIIIPTNDAQLIDLKLIEEELKKLVPTDISGYLLDFSTSTEASAMAFKAAFADAMTPYYNYSMYLCGIPKVKVLGVDSDWDKMLYSLDKLKEILDNDKYFDKVSGAITIIKNNIDNNNTEFWSNIFKLKKCGSGHQYEVETWILDFFMEKQRPGYVDNYPTNISIVPYKLLGHNIDFELTYGLFSSNEEDGFLVPDFGYIINEKQK